MGLYLAGFVLVIAGLLTAIKPGDRTLPIGLLLGVGGATLLFLSGGQAYPTLVLLGILFGFGYFLRARPAVAVENEDADDVDLAS